MHDLQNKRVTVAGLGRFGGGSSAARWLVEQGARVLVTDQAKPETLAASLKQLEGLPIEVVLGEFREQDFRDTDLVVASPAIPPSSEFLQIAKASGVPVTTEICLFIERCPAKIFGVTGTKGKSTTTALLGRMLENRFKVWVGGNIGKSLLFDLPQIKPDDFVVLELSSYMLDYLREMQWSPHVAVMTMISADHLEWHGSLQAYYDAKKTILKFQQPTDFAALNEENGATTDMTYTTRAKVIWYGITNRKPFEFPVPGRHNQLNAQAAFAAASVKGITWDEAQAAIRDFRGLPHRLELVHEAHGVRYFNDSIATIPEAAVAALDSFPPHTVIQIVGGHDKHLPLTAMCGALTERAKAVLCIGTTGQQIAELVSGSESPTTGGAAVYRCGDLPTAMKIARQIATTGDTVLLSTGAASYDQFSNFQERGELFTKLAREHR